MAKLDDRILELVRATPSLTDRELTDRLLGPRVPQQRVNPITRRLAAAGQLVRRKRSYGRISNYPLE